MAQYLIEVGYTPEAWKNQVDNQANVIERITPAVRAVKGTIECVYYAFGDADLIGIFDFPTPEDAAAFSLAVTSSGAIRSYKTTPLLTVAQGIESMKRATKVRDKYTPPITVNLVQQGAKTR